MQATIKSLQKNVWKNFKQILTTFTVRYSVPEVKWQNGREGELDFWRSWFETKGLHWHNEYLSRTNPNSPLQDFIAQHVPCGKKEAYILDVGAGPLTNVGYTIKGYDMFITAVDPLAFYYDIILSEFNITPPIRTIYGLGENLGDLFEHNSFDIVYSCNALDHSADPVKAIQQMINVCKQDGVVLLHHARNEGRRENYNGFHQWNFDVSNGKLLIWRPGKCINITDILCESKVDTIIDDNLIIVTITKRSSY